MQASMDEKGIGTDGRWHRVMHALCGVERICHLQCGGRDLDCCLQVCLDGLIEAFGADMGLLVIRDARTGEIYASDKGLPDGLGPSLVTAICDDLMSRQTATVAPDAGSFACLFPAEKGRQWITVPMAFADELDGVLMLSSRDASDGRLGDSALLEVAAQHTASLLRSSITNGILAQQSALHRGLLSLSLALNSDAPSDEVLQLIVEVSLEVTEGSAACLVTLDESGSEVTGWYAPPQLDQQDLRYAEGRIRDSIAQRDIVLGRSSESPDWAEIALPILADTTPVAGLWLRRRSGTAFRRHEISGLRLLAAMAATALHNVQLRRLARRRQEHLERVAAQALHEEARSRTLFEIATEVGATGDLHQILADLSRAACEQIGFERVRAYLADHEDQVLRAQVEARRYEEPRRWEEETVPLTPGVRHPLTKAALGGAPFIIETAQATGEGEAPQYERLTVPMVAQQLLVGLIVADNPQSGATVTPAQTRMLQSLAGLGSVAIERARVDRLRSALVSSVSHELRAPLASIRAYNELVMSGDAGPVTDEQHTYLMRVERSCARLERVICDLMHLSKLRAGEVAVTLGPTDLTRVCEGVLDTMHPRAASADVTLEFEERGPLPPVMTDAGRLEQVLTNLVDNAIKFNEPGGRVRIVLARQDGEALISVADDGPGIPHSQQAAIFNEFHHGTDSKSRAKEGAGLGLAIVSRVVRLLGGRISLDSEVGKGSTFHVLLPMEPTLRAPASADSTATAALPRESGGPHDRSQRTHH